MCIHHWIIDQDNYGRCKKCLEKRQFPRHPMVEDRFRGAKVFTANAVVQNSREDEERERYAVGAIELWNRRAGDRTGG